MVTSKDVWKFQNSRVIVHFDEDSGQPIKESGGLLKSWIGQLSNDVNCYPLTIVIGGWLILTLRTKSGK